MVSTDDDSGAAPAAVGEVVGLCGLCLDDTHPVAPGFAAMGAGVEAEAEEAHPSASGIVMPDAGERAGVAGEVLSMHAVDRPQEVPGQSQEQPDTVTLDGSMLSGLDRAFVPRLQRVAERMWEEHGLRVQVVEGYRSQERQNTLFAQGRSTDGPVVTWTRNSLHTAGVAADVYIDGAPVTVQDAAVLARVASEEGLRTLYPYDSGHIQLASARAEGPDVPGDQSLPQRPAVGTGSTGGVARVAPVARPARPARPGGMVMSEPGEPGPATGEGGPTDATGEGRTVHARTTLAAASAVGRLRPDGSTARAASPGSGPARPGEDPGVPKGDSATGAAGAAGEANAADAGSGRGHPISPPPVDTPLSRAAQAASGSSGAEAVDPPAPVDFAELREGLAYRRVRLPIDGLAGRASLDLGVGPGAVDARLNVSDPQLADRLQASLHELRQVLAERGVEARGLSVRLTAEAGSEMLTGRAESLASARPGEGEGGQTFSDTGRRRSARHEDAAESHDERRSAPRNEDSREDRDDIHR